ncbi:hypothetical protein MLD38_029157 [Melastoma candidum]|uniref:Uncharacterized protein n=1 Tax=Melastoma candidum TaxID=119954 RepID=A0ACB9N4K9_9MYRT|nr:hypothetical protein MLD38_029157 [Melastoma candidum]
MGSVRLDKLTEEGVLPPSSSPLFAHHTPPTYCPPIDARTMVLKDISPLSSLLFSSFFFFSVLRRLASTLSSSSIQSSSAGRSSGLSESAVLGIVLEGCVASFIVAALLMVVCLAKPEESPETGKKTAKREGSIKKKPAAADDQEKDNKIMFFIGDSHAFNLDDLLRASAEVLGKGTFGVTYKAALEDGAIVVVKRLKDMHVRRREFEQQMEVGGRMKHENVAPLRAYYCSKDEKLPIYDHYSRGSLYSNLHDKGERRAPLDWESRLQIGIGIAQGIAYIHMQNGGRYYHGNLKVSQRFIGFTGTSSCI